MNRILITSILIISCIRAEGQVQDDFAIKLDQYLASANNAYRFNGVALVLHNNAVVLNKGYGFSNMDLKTPNSPETRFPILSITKTITSTIILKLQDEKKLSVNDKITKYFPECPQWSWVTIHHLLTHSSGIYSYTDGFGKKDSALVNHPLSKESVVNYFRDRKLEFPPGKRYSYNNSGYFLLGLIIEKVTGKPYEMVVKEIIFNPLGMTQSGFDFINLPKSVKAQGYQFWDKDKVVPYKHYDSTFAYSAGSIYSTTNDMRKWAGAVSSQQILAPGTWSLAFKPEIQNYGYGWMSGQFFGKKYVRHSGGYPGFMSEFIYYPDEKLTIVLLNNFGTYGQNVWSVGMGISLIMFGLPYDEWKLRDDVIIGKRTLEGHAGNYVNGKSTIKIKLRDNDLYAVISGLGEIKLYAESDTLYYFKDFNATFKFQGQHMIVHEHGQESRWTRK